MTIAACLPIIGILLLPYSLARVYHRIVRSSPWLSQNWCALTARSAILGCSRSDSLMASMVIGLSLIYFGATHEASLIKPLWAAGVIGFFLLIYVEYHRKSSLNPVLFAFFLGLPLSAIFSLLGPASALNFDDDLAKYLVLPIGLIQDNGLDFGPLGPQVGSASTLAAGLQALYLLGIELKWVAHWDIAVSLTLIIIFISFGYGSFLRDVSHRWIAGASMVVSAFLVNVMYVNISAVYLPATLFSLMGGLVVGNRSRSLLEAFGVGSFAAIFYLFKTNYILLSLALLGGYFLIVALDARLRLLNKLILFGACFSAFSVFAMDAVSKIFNALVATLGSARKKIGLGAEAELSSNSKDASSDPFAYFDTMFSLKPTFYGYGVDSYFSINVFIALFSFVSLLGLLGSSLGVLGEPRSSAQRVGLFSLIWILSSLILLSQYYLFSNSIGAVDANIRYMMPAVLALVLVAVYTWWITQAENRTRIQKALMLAVIAFLGSQITSAGHRLYQSVKYGNVLAFPAAREELMEAHTSFVVGGNGRDFVGKLQSLVPEGSTILVAAGFPSLFDFQRNKILLAEANGDLDQFADSEWFLKKHSIDFIFWQTRGLGVRTVGQWEAWGSTSSSRAQFSRKNISFLRELARLAKKCETVAPIEQLVIVKVAGCSF